MTSKTSFFSILKEDLRRRVWMLALSVLASFISMPIAFLLANRSYLYHASLQNLSRSFALQEYYVEFFHSYGALFQSIVLGLGAIIVAVWGFRHLYSRKMVDLYHSIPVKRETLFFAFYINGLIIWLFPMLIATLATVLIALGNLSVYSSLSLAGPVIIASVKLISVSILAFLSIYHFALVCVMLSGNVVNALFQIVVFGLSVTGFYLILELLCDTYFATYAGAVIAPEHILWASPLVGPFRLMSDYTTHSVGALFWNITKSSIQNPLLFRILSLLLMMFHFILAVHLCRKRPSELAEHGIDHKPTQILMRFCAGTLSALFGALIFIWLVDEQALGWQIFGILFCGILGLGVTEIIMQMNFKAFFLHKLQMGLCLAFSILTLTVIFFDLTGFDHRLPDKNRILSASVTLSHYKDSSYYLTFDGNTIISTDFDESKAYTDLDTLYPLLESVTASDRTNRSGSGNITVTLKTPLGLFHRKYRILEEDLELVRPIVENKEYLEKFYPVSLGLLPRPKELYINTEADNLHYAFNEPEKIREIFAAYREDFKNNSTLETLHTGFCVGILEFAYPYRYPGSSSHQNYYLDLQLFSHYTGTLAKIREYYPEFTVDPEELEITSLELSSRRTNMNSLFGLPEYDLEEEALKESIDYLTIKDPKEIAMLLPYLEIGYTEHGMFPAASDVYYVGLAHLESGNSCSVYVTGSSLPLPLTNSLKELEEALRKEP